MKVETFGMRYFFLLILFVSVCFCSMAQQAVLTRGEDGRVVKSQHDVYNIANQLAVRIEYTYDSLGTVRYRTLTSYDKKGRIVCREQYNAFDYLLLEDVFKYDRRGNLKRRNTTTIEETGETHRSEETRKYKYKKDSIVYRAYYLDGKLYYEEPPTPVDTTAKKSFSLFSIFKSKKEAASEEDVAPQQTTAPAEKKDTPQQTTKPAENAAPSANSDIEPEDAQEEPQADEPKPAKQKNKSRRRK